MEGRGRWAIGAFILMAAIFFLEFLALFDGRMLDNDDSSKICTCNSNGTSGKFWKLNKRFIVNEEFFSKNMTNECHQINFKVDEFNFLMGGGIEEFQKDGTFLEDYLPKLKSDNTTTDTNNITIPMTSTTEVINTTTLPNIPNAVVFYSTKYNMLPLIDNKLNAMDSGQKLSISPDGLEARHSGPKGYSCVRAVLPISPFNLTEEKPKIAYYEMRILKTVSWGSEIQIGFCDKEFPLEGNMLGFNVKNSIGIMRKRKMWIDIEGGKNKIDLNFGEPDWFVDFDVIGIGIIQRPDSSFKCFATINGGILGAANLSPKFATLQFFPVVCLGEGQDAVRVNFGKEYWRFWEFDKPILLL